MLVHIHVFSTQLDFVLSIHNDRENCKTIFSLPKIFADLDCLDFLNLPHTYNKFASHLEVCKQVICNNYLLDTYDLLEVNSFNGFKQAY